MQTLTSTLLSKQQGVIPLTDVFVKVTFSKAGESDIVVEEDRILRAVGDETSDSQVINIFFDNSDGYFTSLDLKGWSVVAQRGLRTSTGIEYISSPPMIVEAMDFSSSPRTLRCAMSFEGRPNRLAKDEASKTYLNHWSNTKTPKDLITEIASGVAVDTELTEQQLIADSNYALFATSPYTTIGQRMGMPNRTVTKLAFQLWKMGSPGGNVTFTLATAPEGSILAQKTLATSEITNSTPGIMYEVTLTTPILLDRPLTYVDGVATGGAWITATYTGGDVNNCVVVRSNSVAVKPNEWWMGGAGSPDEDWEDINQDCAYSYKYTKGTGNYPGTSIPVTNGVYCFSHCVACDVVYDSEDALIDTYVPADGFRINEGSSRLDAINRLLGYTTCTGRWQADGKIHVFVPTSTGEVYDYQYEIEKGITIDVGPGATDRDYSAAALYTYIDLNNPANVSGVLTQIEIWAYANMTGLRVGTFYLVSGTTYKCRDSVAVGSVTAGSKRTFSTELTVVAGDFLGCYFATGTLDSQDAGSGIMYKSGEYIDPDDSTSYTLTADTTFSLYASRGASHEFFAKSIRNALVSPNKITVHSYEDGVLIEGSATDATSYALKPVEHFVRADCATGGEAQSIAAAMIAQLVMASQRGSAQVPMNLGAEVYDYVKVTDSRENDSRTGNLGRIHWSYVPGKEFNMSFSFGQRVSAAIQGVRSSPYTFPKPETLSQAEFNSLVEETVTGQDKDIAQIQKAIGIVEGEAPTSDQIATGTIGFIRKLLDDKLPTLGADLIVNSKLINGDLIAHGSGHNLGSLATPWGYVDANVLRLEQYLYMLKLTHSLVFYVPNTANSAAVGVMILWDGDVPYLDMSSHKIAGVLDPTSNQDAATKIYADTRDEYVSFTTIASATLKKSDDDEKTTGVKSATSAYIKLKEVRIVKVGVTGVRVKFDIDSFGDGTAANSGFWGQICKNSTGALEGNDCNGHIGTLQTIGITGDGSLGHAYVTKSEDLTLSVVVGDLIQIWGRVIVGDGTWASGYIMNFRFYYTLSDATISMVNQDP